MQLLGGLQAQEFLLRQCIPLDTLAQCISFNGQRDIERAKSLARKYEDILDEWS